MSGKLDEAIAEIKDVLIPFHKTMKQVSASMDEKLFILGCLAEDNKNLLVILLRKNEIEEAMAVSNTFDEIIAEATKLLATETLESNQNLEFQRKSCEEHQK